MERLNWRHYITGMLLVIALIASTKALYLSGKAVVAQFLLQRAWHASQQLAQPVKPWPWADTHAVALLQVPRLAVQQVVLHSHSGQALAFGPGLVEHNTSRVVAGHRDSHFDFLEDLQLGDTILWTDHLGQRMHYRITDRYQFDSRQSPVITPPSNSLVLITCYPYNATTAVDSGRLLLMAEKADGLKI